MGGATYGWLSAKDEERLTWIIVNVSDYKANIYDGKKFKVHLEPGQEARASNPTDFYWARVFLTPASIRDVYLVETSQGWEVVYP